jgi:hypothetical protein
MFEDGEEVIERRLGYSANSIFPEMGNCVMLAGLGRMYDRKTWVEGDKIIGETQGQYYVQPYYNPPTTFIRKYRREISRDGVNVVLRDYIDMDDPRTLPKLDRYRAADKARIDAAGDDLVQLVFHMPVKPTIEPNAVLWQTKGGKQLKISWSDDRQVKVIDESLLWPSETMYTEAWQVRLVPKNFKGGVLDLTTRVEIN